MVAELELSRLDAELYIKQVSGWGICVGHENGVFSFDGVSEE
jgi:hypothetical protein